MEITYFPSAQFARSIILQRSLQKGMKGSPKETGFLQMGHFIFFYRWGRTFGVERGARIGK